jgi:hypothetical protein
MPTTGSGSGRPPAEPRNRAFPKLKIPPSAATIQYPAPRWVAASPTTGETSGVPPIDPRKGASPKLKIPPSEATSQ